MAPRRQDIDEFSVQMQSADTGSVPASPLNKSLASWRLGGFFSSNVAIILAVMAPLAGGRSLLQGPAAWGLAGWLSLAAVLAGLVALSAGYSRDLAAGVRWLAWLGLGTAPLWSAGPLLGAAPAWVWVSLAYLVVIPAVAAAGRVSYLRGSSWLPVITCWGLAGLAALSALLR
jgi:hypothetical protein